MNSGSRSRVDSVYEGLPQVAIQQQNCRSRGNDSPMSQVHQHVAKGVLLVVAMCVLTKSLLVLSSVLLQVPRCDPA